MKSNVANLRKSYEKGVLNKKAVGQTPFQLFSTWFEEAKLSDQIEEANAMSLSTLGVDGFPKARVVLLKDFSEAGFVFYTNYNSEKGQALINNPNVGLTFFWPFLERQVIIKGVAKKEAISVSETYFHSRPHGSQLGALVSPQSEVIPDRKFLEERLMVLEEQYKDIEIPMPKHWGGIIVEPKEIEFWQGRPNRLHDRIRCQLIDNSEWKIDRLAP
jgi:pyridoxamine 5'-phosphate oxidase